MPQSCSSVLVHLVFSTKHREPWLRDSIEPELHAYGTTVLKNAGCPAIAVNGAADHVHLLFHLSRVKTIAQVVEAIKTSTSRWIKTKGREYRMFGWQNGYGAFSVSRSNVERVVEYIQNQKTHHARRTYQDEFRALLRKHDVAFDERYVWD
jgi:REP element-mobilizing transposase RayT